MAMGSAGEGVIMDQQKQDATASDEVAEAGVHYPAGIGVFQAWAFGLIALTVVLLILAVIVGLVLEPSRL